MNQNSLEEKIGAEFLSKRTCFICGKEIFVRNVRANSYCSQECYEARGYAKRFTNKEVGLLTPEVQAAIKGRYNRSGVYRQQAQRVADLEVERQKRLDHEEKQRDNRGNEIERRRNLYV